jgi:hypothetical protein
MLSRGKICHLCTAIFGVAVIPVGLGHIFYVEITASLVPSWLPFRVALAYLIGIGQIACGLGIPSWSYHVSLPLSKRRCWLCSPFSCWGRILGLLALQSWRERRLAHGFLLTAFLITWVIGASALLIANNTVSNKLKSTSVSRIRDKQTDAAKS